jgi:hypothetical protein
MSKRPRLRIIGDCHAKHHEYVKLLDADYTIQVGDMGFSDTYDFLNKEVNPKYHRFIPGNHDAYDCLPEHSLGNFGIYNVPTFGDVFFVRGAFSIDVAYRKSIMSKGAAKCWWSEEELPYSELEKAIELYKQVKPDFVVAHDAPTCITREISDPSITRSFGFPDYIRTRTGEALQMMFESHAPQYFVFGHWHMSWNKFRNGCHFICLNELEHLDFHKKLVPSFPKKVNNS